MKNKLSDFLQYLGLGREHKVIAFVCLSVIGIFQCVPGKERSADVLEIEVQNPLAQSRKHVLIQIPEDKNVFSVNDQLVAVDGDKIIPVQYDPQKGLLLVVDQLRSNEKRSLIIRRAQEDDNTDFKKRTQAELSVKTGGHFENRKYIGGDFENIDSLRVPDEHTDHSYYIRYEGPGWESDKVGYRLYLDWRNATDVFGKKTDAVVLQEVGQDGFDSYHEMQDWGMDVLKVGQSLGIGAPALFHNEKAIRIDSTDSVISKVAANGNIYSAIQNNYYGWKVADKKLDITSLYSIYAGTRLTHHQLQVEGNPENIATGIGKSELATFYSDKGNEGRYGYLATYGQQSLNNDKLGLAVLFPADKVLELTEDQHSHIVTLDPSGGEVDYYFLAAWELEPDGIKNEEQFIAYLTKTATELANPVLVKIK